MTAAKTLNTNLKTDSEQMDNRTRFKYSAFSSLFWIAVGHAYFFFSDAYSFDSLHTVAQSDYSWKISLGRFAQPIYKTLIRGNISAPWLIGVCTVLYLCLSLYLLSKCLNIRSGWSIFAMAGVLGVNLQVIITVASYVHEVDVFMLAFLLQTVAVYLWKMYGKGKHQIIFLILGSFCIAFSIGLYQAYISAGITLVIIVLLSESFDRHIRTRSIWVHAVKAVIMFLIGGILYYCMVQISLKMYPYITLTSDTNGLTNLFNYSGQSFAGLFRSAYTGPLSFFFSTATLYMPQYVIIINWILLILLFLCTILINLHNRSRMAVSIILLFCLPAAMASIRFLNPNSNYELLIYADFLFYVAVILAVDTLASRLIQVKTGSVLQRTAWILVICIACCNVRFANQVYLKKDLESQAFKLYMTEINTAMDSVEGYEPGVTPVLFLSSPEMTPIGYEYTDAFNDFNELNVTSFYATKYRFQWYYQFILQRPIVFLDDTDAIARFQEMPQVQEMPVYPAKGSMQIIEWTLVVNLSDHTW